MGFEAAPELGELTGSIAYELEETFKSNGIKLQSWDDIGDIELRFADGKRFRVEVIELDEDDPTDIEDDDEAA